MPLIDFLRIVTRRTKLPKIVFTNLNDMNIHIEE